MQNSKQFWLFNLLNLFLLIATGYWLWSQNQAVSLPPAHIDANAKLQCVSYSPYYHEGVTPLDPNTHIYPSQIDDDLRLLAEHFDCVRIYSVGQGLDYVPEAAKKLGLKVLLGAWIGWIKPANEKELNLAIKLANEYPDTIKAIIIGNEVLLRGEQTEATLQGYIERVKQATKVPVTYADVWEFWRKHKSLENSVDFVTVHVLPYWEDNPQSIDHAIQHASNVMGILSKEFSKPIFIGETGWPSTGRQRGPSIPTQINQARYLRDFINTAQEKNWNYNLIEGVDQSWKRMNEGTVGGYWGLYDIQLHPKFSFTEPVSERHDGMQPIFWGLAGLTMLLIISAFLNQKTPASMIGTALLGFLMGMTAYIQVDYLQTACRVYYEWIALGAVLVAGVLSQILLISHLTQQKTTASKSLIFINTFIALAAAVCGILLSIDGRYRDFPISLYLLPVIQLSLSATIFGLASVKRSNWVDLIFGVACVTALFCALRELQNIHALSWLAITLILASSIFTFAKQHHD